MNHGVLISPSSHFQVAFSDPISLPPVQYKTNASGTLYNKVYEKKIVVTLDAYS